MQITIVLSTARKERKSERVFRALVERFEVKDGVSVEAVDIKDHLERPETVPPWGSGGANEQPTKWKEVVERSDAFVFVIPEYNHGYPGEWKLLVDSLFDEYKGKRAYIASVSGGMFSGVRVADHIKPVLVELNFDVQKTGLHVGQVKTSITEEGVVEDEKLNGRIEKFVDQVAVAS